MIRFALKCSAGHQFDAWFSSGDSFDEQSEAEAIRCPDCGSADVCKAPMAPAVLRGRGKAPASADSGCPDGQPASGELSHKGQTYAFVKGLREHLKANADDVGDKFADEARKMHHGETEERNIFGQATMDEAKSLYEEGIPAFPVPKLPDEHN